MRKSALSHGCEELVEQACPHGHLIQLYEPDDRSLVDSVAAYFAEGLRRQQGAIVAATARHHEAFLDALERLGAQVDPALARQQLVMIDAHTLLARFMIGGYPDAALFDESVGLTVRRAHDRADGRGLRVYGEMVGELWRTKQFRAAVRLEHLWNKLGESVAFHLYCSYPIDIFDEHLNMGVLDELLCAHTHLLPAGHEGYLERAVTRAMDDVLGAQARRVGPLVNEGHRHVWAAMPRGEATIFWLREHLPDRQEEILRLARRYYNASHEAAPRGGATT